MQGENSIIKLNNVTFGYPEMNNPLFKDLSANLPDGITTLVGQNGTGKSTFMLLAGGRVTPNSGTVEILGKDSSLITSEEERNKTVSFIYQNMEFETDAPIGSLMEYILQQGNADAKNNNLIITLLQELDLKKVTNLPTQKLSKGQLQKTIIAFSILYGSSIIMMDEPIFALEYNQKEKVLDFLFNYSKDNNISIFYSLHELELSKKYAESTILFYKDRKPMLGPTEELFKRDIIEDVYQVPYGMLYKKEELFRDRLYQTGKRAADKAENSRNNK